MHDCKWIHELDIFEEVTNVLNIGAVFSVALESEPRLVKHLLDFLLVCGRLHHWGQRLEGTWF